MLIAVGMYFTVPRFMQMRQTAAVPKVARSPFEEHQQLPSSAPAMPISGKPVRIQIPSLAIDLPITDGSYNARTKKWTLTTNKVQYAVNTPLANNQSGSTFLYGHNRREVFRSLLKIKLGAEATITADNGHTFTYKFTGALVTTPSDTSLFNYQGPPILTVQTCSGAFYQDRQLFTFALVQAA